MADPKGGQHMSDDRYRPRSFTDDPGPDPVSFINEPIAPDNVSSLVRTSRRSLHAVLCEALTNTQARVLGDWRPCAARWRAGGRLGALYCHAAATRRPDGRSAARRLLLRSRPGRMGDLCNWKLGLPTMIVCFFNATMRSRLLWCRGGKPPPWRRAAGSFNL